MFGFRTTGAHVEQETHTVSLSSFLLNPKPDLFDPQVSQDLPFLHPSETSVLNRLSKLGSDYIRFTEFIEQHTGHVHQQVSESSWHITNLG